MRYTLKLLFTASGETTAHDGEYLVEFRAPAMNARGEYVGGILRTTPNLADAKRFETQADAIVLYRQTNGRRPDGQPNRPLCAYTIEISDVADAHA